MIGDSGLGVASGPPAPGKAGPLSLNKPTDQRMMNMVKQNEIWLKAAVIGSLWGASEIVLGSFLHNLRIPFSGNILTAIGIILMVSGHRLWPHRGIIIRAGLICAALKSLSPSPIILGPMLSILMQASLMEAAILIGRKSHAGYILGGGLAVSWNLLYRILSSIVLYGSSLIALYQNLVNYLVSQTAWEVQGYWGPIMILWALFFSWGAIAGTVGILISRAAEKTAYSWEIPQTKTKPRPLNLPAKPASKWSLLRPLLILVLLATGLYSIALLPILHTLPMLLLFLVIVWMVNRQLLLRLSMKRGFWMAVAIMMCLSGFLMGPGHGFTREGLIVGLEMVMRAIYVIAGFGIISKELQRPEMISLFIGKNMAPFLSAVRIAFQTTPLLIETIPGKQAWRRPVKVLTNMVGSMEYSLNYMRTQNRESREVFIVTGGKGIGKTTLTGQITEILKKQGLRPAGILAPAFFEKGERIGYMVKSLKTGEEKRLCKRSAHLGKHLPGCYRFDPEGMLLGEAILSGKKTDDVDLLVIDELGPYEMKGLGWDTALKSLLRHWEGPMLWAVRESLIDEMAKRYGARVSAVFHAGKTPADTAAKTIYNKLIGQLAPPTQQVSK